MNDEDFEAMVEGKGVPWSSREEVRNLVAEVIGRNFKMVMLRNSGMTFREIGSRFSITGNRVLQIYNAYNRRMVRER